MKMQFIASTMIKWNLAELMDLYAIKTKDLAEALDISASSASNLRNSQSMPRIDGKRLSQIITAINAINQGRKNKSRVLPADLIQYIPDEKAGA